MKYWDFLLCSKIERDFMIPEESETKELRFILAAGAEA
jgi:hypothetical protein